MVSEKRIGRKADQDFVYSEKEERNMDIEFVPPPEKPRKVSGLVRLLCWGLFVFVAVSSISLGEYETGSAGWEILRFMMMGIFAAMFAWLCARMAEKIGRNLDFAWMLGFMFGFAGFAVYWVYYRICLRRENKPKAKKGRTKKRKKDL